MKKSALLVLILMAISSTNLFSQTSGTGLGIMVGEPSGISFKHWVAPNHAVDAGLAWLFADNGNFQLHADYLYHANVFELNNSAGYIGIGGRIMFRNSDKGETDNRFGVRVPAGLNFYFPEPKLDVFIEIAPILDLTPSSKFSINGLAGVRYFFNQ